MNIIKKILDKYGKESRISLFLIEFCDLDIKKYYPELSAEEFRVIKTKANKSFLYYRISFLCLLYIGLDLVFITNDLGLTKENKMYYLIFFNVLFLLSICSAVKANKKNKEKISQQVQLLAHQEQREAMMKSWESWPEQENGDPVALEKQLRELIDSKHEIIRVQDNLSPEELTVIYLTEKELGEKNGYFPVIVQLSIDLMEFAADRKNEPDNSEQMDATEFQKKAIEEHLKDYEEGDVLGSDDKEGEDLLAAHIGKREEAEGPKINTLNYLQEKGKLVLVRFLVDHPHLVLDTEARLHVVDFHSDVGTDLTLHHKARVIMQRKGRHQARVGAALGIVLFGVPLEAYVHGSLEHQLGLVQAKILHPGGHGHRYRNVEYRTSFWSFIAAVLLAHQAVQPQVLATDIVHIRHIVSQFRVVGGPQGGGVPRKAVHPLFAHIHFTGGDINVMTIDLAPVVLHEPRGRPDATERQHAVQGGG